MSDTDQQRVLKRIVELGDSKQRITADDLPFIIADVLERQQIEHVSLARCDLESQWGKQATASIELVYDEKTYSAEGKGNGGYDAFMAALQKIVPQLGIALPVLYDYKVHIPRGGQSSALTEASITWQFPDGKKITTRSTNANQVYAAIEATLRLINLLIAVLGSE
ncbi:MAG: alpha-isopropylmalate synthase regulatory domain-containing protein [Pseudomonadales bacterium]